MDSKDLDQLGFRWHLWRNLTKSGLWFKESGVYAIKSMAIEQRKKGSSDILWIGSSGDLMERIFKNYLFNVGGSTTKRIHKKLFEEGYLDKTEIGWVTPENFEKLEKYLEKTIKWPSRTRQEELEKRLKLRFEKEHGEYPPWNKVL